MPVEVSLDSPLASQLQNVVQAKVAETGWSGLDDNGLSEYIVLMLVNGKSQQQVASELSTDLLDIGPDDPSAIEFSHWLFDQVERLANPGASDSTAAVDMMPTSNAEATTDADMGNLGGTPATHVDDANGASTDTSIPTGPKSMRDGSGRGRDKRFGGTAGRQNTRTPDTGIHRIKGTANRVNSHNRDPPRGPAPRGPRGNMRGNANTSRMQTAMQNQINAMTGQGNGFNPMQTSSEQMQLLAMQQQMLATLMTPEQQEAFVNGMNGMGMGQMPLAGGNPRFDSNPGRQGGGHLKRRNGGFQSNGDTDAMDLTSSMEGNDGSQKFDASTTMCRYNLFCTKPECGFVHQSPAAPPDTAVDMNDTCSFGALCTNKKCTGRHPSPATRAEHASPTGAMCRYWPNCTNPHCSFIHPTTPICRNGADCATPNCSFAHPTIECKYNPCLNPACPYKHVEGQKRSKVKDNVWVNPESKNGEHHPSRDVSERKFVDESLPVETVLPGSGNNDAKVDEDMSVPA